MKNVFSTVMTDLVEEVKGLNKIHLKFRAFFMDVLTDATFYLSETSSMAKTEFERIFDILLPAVVASVSPFITPPI